MSEEQECPHCDQEIPNDIWRDPGVKSALKSGRSAEDIMVLACPKCGRFGYYNQGSSFWCRFCQQGFQCLSEGEESDGLCVYLDGMDAPMTLADTVTDVTGGYYNETRRQAPSITAEQQLSPTEFSESGENNTPPTTHTPNQ